MLLCTKLIEDTVLILVLSDIFGLTRTSSSPGKFHTFSGVIA